MQLETFTILLFIKTKSKTYITSWQLIFCICGRLSDFIGKDETFIWIESEVNKRPSSHLPSSFYLIQDLRFGSSWSQLWEVEYTLERLPVCQETKTTSHTYGIKLENTSLNNMCMVWSVLLLCLVIIWDVLSYALLKKCVLFVLLLKGAHLWPELMTDLYKVETKRVKTPPCKKYKVYTFFLQRYYEVLFWKLTFWYVY